MPSRSNPLLRLLIVAAATPLLSACNTIDVKQFTYEMLRQEDCRRNELESFCSRTFHKDYKEYELLRREFQREQEDTTWRAASNQT